MTGAVDVRRLMEGDADDWQSLRLKGLKEAPTAFSSSFEEESKRTRDSVRERFRTSLSAPTNAVFGAFKGEALVGCIGIYSDGRRKTGHKMMIWGMYVDTVLRNQGIGKLLVGGAIALARGAPGIVKVELTVESSNRSAIALYQSMGFKTWGIEHQALRIEGVFYDEERMSLVL